MALERKSFELLRYLIRHAGDVVTRDELIEGVWSGRVVSDSVVSRTVMKVRKALHDRDQQIVATVHGYGYRLSVPVTVRRTERTTSVETIAPASEGASDLRRRSVFAVATMLMLSLVVVFAWNRFGTATAPRLALLPVAVEDAPTADWAELGLMAYLTTTLGREFEVLPAGKVLDAVGEDRSGGVERLRAAHGALDVVEMSLAGAGDGVQLRYTLHRVGRSTLSGSLNADSALAAADRLLERLNAALDGDWSTPSAGPLARELYARGRAAMLAGDARSARDYLQAALRENPDMAWARYEMALAWRQLGEPEKARTALEELAAEPGLEPRLAAGVRQALAIMSWRAGDLAGAEAGYRAALEIAESNGLADLLPGQLMNLGIVSRSRGEYERARELYLRALHLSRERGNRDTQARVHNSLGVLAWKTGAMDASYREHTRALELRRKLDRPRDLAASLNNLASVAIVRGRWIEAESLLAQAADIRDELGDGAGLATTTYNLAKLALLRGQLDGAESLALESLALAQEHGYASAEAGGFLLGGRIALRRGDARTARERFEAARHAYERIDQPTEATGVRLDSAYWLGGDAEDALRLAETVLADTSSAKRLRARALLLRASRQATQAPDEAAADWREALAIADRLGDTELAVRAALDFGATLIEAGRVREAEPLMARLGEWPEYAPALHLRARYWEALGNRSRARELLARAEAGTDGQAGPVAERM